ncbi:hypothetical protein HHI36_017995 [Cryptolaemus montrouzieri]|uniref:HTH psq-type domain-containing protein n=1 Tax=Cryptolaemus montrouzieri TaxID=559131 RepID=A0ABD2NZB9_9CUCU
MVDFMYYGEVNVSQEQLPHILKTAEMLKIKGLAEIPMDQSMTRQDTSLSDRAELLATGDTSWNNETAPSQCLSPSPCPSSPSCRRKRLRKSSTGSGSGSLEKSTDDSHHLSESTPTGFNVETVIKSDPNFSTENSSGQKKQNSTDSDLQRGSSHDITDSNSKHHVSLQIPQQEYTQQSLSEPALEVQRSSTSTSHQSDNGLNWTNLVDQTAYGTSVHFSFPQNVAASGENIALSHCMLNMAKNQNPSPSEDLQNTDAPQQQKKKRSVNPQSEENFIKALDAVRFGGIGFCKAARMYGVNNRTLWLEYKKRGYPNFRLSIKNRKSDANEVQIIEEGNVAKIEDTASDKVPREHQDQFVELPGTAALSSNSVSFFDKQIDFGQMIHRMNSAAILGQQQQNVSSYQTVNFDHIN